MAIPSSHRRARQFMQGSIAGPAGALNLAVAEAKYLRVPGATGETVSFVRFWGKDSFPFGAT